MMAQLANPEHAYGVAGVEGSQISGERAANVIQGIDASADPRPFPPGYLLSDIGGESE